MVGLAVILLVGVFQLQRLARVGEDIKRQGVVIQAQNAIIKEQTEINQRYLKCIIILPKESFANTQSRTAALDRCSEESRLPSGKKLE